MDNNIMLSPFGASPHWIELYNRMGELYGAIGRFLLYAYDCPENRVDCYTQISEWAKELSELATLEVKLLKEKEE